MQFCEKRGKIRAVIAFLQKNNMKTTISNLVTLAQGVPFRGQIPKVENGMLAVVQMKNIGERGDIQVDRLDRIAVFPRHEKYLLYPNDILVLSRGTRNTAALVPVGFPLAVAASYFTVMRVVSNTVLPEYLTTYLNGSKIQARIRGLAFGTALPIVSIAAWHQLPVDVPLPARQRLLVELDHACRRAERLELTIQEKRRAAVEWEVMRQYG